MELTGNDQLNKKFKPGKEEFNCSFIPAVLTDFINLLESVQSLADN